jgi:16S rRNA (adenine1518-N6/adenine1519-N6)-dimethyltransferase
MHADLSRVSADAIREELGVPRLKLAGNLPYQLTSHVLFATLDLEDRLEDAVFMVQREVAERIVAPPGTREYGILSVLLRAYHRVRIVQILRPGAFAPPPQVDSAVIRVEPLGSGAAARWAERAALEAAVKSTFNERRKVLRNTLKKFYALDAAALDAVERASAVDLGRRPETLAVEEFVRLTRALPAAVRTPHGASPKGKGAEGD